MVVADPSLKMLIFGVDWQEADYSDEFVAWAAAAFRSKHARKQYRKSMVRAHSLLSMCARS